MKRRRRRHADRTDVADNDVAAVADRGRRDRIMSRIVRPLVQATTATTTATTTTATAADAAAADARRADGRRRDEPPQPVRADHHTVLHGHSVQRDHHAQSVGPAAPRRGGIRSATVLSAGQDPVFARFAILFVQRIRPGVHHNREPHTALPVAVRVRPQRVRGHHEQFPNRMARQSGMFKVPGKRATVRRRERHHHVAATTNGYDRTVSER